MGCKGILETQQWSHAPRSWPEIKNGRSSAEVGQVQKSIQRCRTSPEGEIDPAVDVRSAARRILFPFYLT